MLVLAADWGIAAGLASRPGLFSLPEVLFIPPLFWSGVAPQTVLLSPFVHFDLFHLAFNCVALYLFGIFLEDKRGGRLVLAVFLLSAVIGNLAFAVAKPSEPSILLGASAGVMGIIGALARLAPQEKITILGIGLILPRVRMWVVALVFATIDLSLAVASEYADIWLYGFPSRVAYIAHLGGLAAGFLLAPLLVRVMAAAKVTKVVASGIESIVPGEAGKEIAAALKDERDPEIIAAWMKRIEELAKCPECGSGMESAGRGRFRCAAGHERRVGS
jgi:membrane associated rhomboid family serine protease